MRCSAAAACPTSELSDTVRDLKIEKVASLFDMTSSGVTLGEMDVRLNDPLLVMGKLGGFATNTLMSTVMSAVSMGTLGFGACTAASSILNVVLGPVGIVGSGAVALYQVARPNARRSLQAIATGTIVCQRKLAKHTLELLRSVQVIH